MPSHTKFLWLAWFYTLLLFLFRVQDHKVVWLFFQSEPSLGMIFGAMAGFLWLIYLVQRRKAKRMGA